MTTRVERVNEENYLRFREAGQPIMFVFWHGQLLPLIHYHRQEGIVVLVSEHDDGEYVTRVIRRNGFGTVRGSSTRGGGKGLKRLVRAARQGRDLAVTPDGPTGPPGVFKPGALAAAQMAGLPVVPISVTASAGVALSAAGMGFWFRGRCPRSGSSIWSRRMIPRDADRADLERLADEIGSAMNERAHA